MKPAQADIEAVLNDLAATPDRLAALSAGLDEAQLGLRTKAEPWSVGDILAHLRACADVRGGYIAAMLQQPHPNLRYVSPRTYIRKTNYMDLAFSESLPVFTRQRDELLGTLRPLPAAGWSRGATFTATTRREQTVLSQAQALAEHERAHLEQIETLLPRR